MENWYLTLFSDKYGDQRMIGYPLMKNCVGFMTIVGLYLLFVLKYGPEWMKNRQAFNLRKVLLLFNAIQMFLCAYIVIMIIISVKWTESRCITTQTHSSGDLMLINTAYFYWVVKVIDLLDTIFFVLRKKQNQISTLHVYHHTMMVAAGWIVNRIYPGGELVWLGLFNCIVHIFMYFYYFCAVYYDGKINLWWKKYITQGQIVQFVSLLAIYGIKMFDSSCSYPKWLLTFHILQVSILLYMFVNFYYRAYCKPKKVLKRVQDQEMGKID